MVINKIIRVFPRRTNMTPDDEYSFVGMPPFAQFIPDHNAIHISVVFTWDKLYAEQLQKNWQEITDKPVLIGGTAYDDPGLEFIPGMYVKPGITITSRGCPNNCDFCLVPKREGKIRELPIQRGNIIQDNNILACSDVHIDKVFEMLKHEKGICFKGGLEARRITTKIADKLARLKIKELWLACDKPEHLKVTIKAIHTLRKAGFSQNYIRCYVLIGFDKEEERYRLEELYKSGCLPFAQLYRKDDDSVKYTDDWKKFARVWSRPAIYKAVMKGKGIENLIRSMR